MNPAQLLAHFDRFADAPDAIPRLRHFILDLAMRGKLVEQDTNGEPAAGLLQRMQAQKEQMLKAGEIKKLERFEAVRVDEIPFAIPSGWEAVRMGWLARKLGAGSTPLGGKSVYQSEGVAFLRSQNVHNDGLRLNDVALISRSVHDRMSGTHVQQEDILLNITGASIGRCALVPSTFVEGNVSQHVAIIRLIDPSIREFIHLSLTSPFFQKVIDDVQVGVSREGLSMQRLRLFPMLIPPLAEQHRIVAKVDELMALCDRLEAAQAERERRRERLAAASLHRLNQPDGGDALRDQARFYLQHLPRITTRPEQIAQLRQTILNLAVRGKLVAQEPKDEPVQRTAQATPSTMDFDAHVFTEALIALVLPPHWSVEPLTRISAAIVDCPHSTPKWTASGKICVRTNQFRPGLLDLSDARFVDEETYRDRIQRLEPVENDILYSREGGILGVACRVPAGVQLCLGQRMMLIRAGTRIDPIFLEFVLNSPLVTTIARGRTTGGAAPRVNVATIRAYPIPLPPLAEQHRIVAKVDELMALCDRLEGQLTATQTDSRRLLDAVLHQALAAATEVST